MRVLLLNPGVLTVDPYQVYAYADVVPYGLFQIATLLHDQGHQVRVVDMMGYLEGDYASVISALHRFATKPCADVKTDGVSREVYLYGHGPEWLEERLREGPAPDEVLVTCCLSFNWEPAHRVVHECRAAFPKARIRFGGFYPTAFPEHARSSGADEIYQGRWEEADRVFPRLDMCGRVPRNWLFRLVSGCRYRCSFCVNSSMEPRVHCDPRDAAAEVRKLHEAYGIEEFSNWDPNILQVPDVLTTFLEELSRGDLSVGLRFDMGISPHLLTRELAVRMREAGTVAMTIPFESADPQMMRRFGKPYRVDSSVRALEICRDVGFDISRFHCTFILGVRGEDLRDVFRTYLMILRSGGKPTPFPLTPTPGTREYKLHQEYLQGKDLDLLNGHLWPTQGPGHMVALYEQVLKVVASLDIDTARSEAARLPEEIRTIFEQEADNMLRTCPGGLGSRTGRLPEPPLFSLPAWLHALCQGCIDLEECSQRETRREPDPERCFRERRGVDLTHMAALFDDLRRSAGIGDDQRLARHEQRMWSHLEDLQTRCANTFEPSMTWDGHKWNCYRYTYSFHDGVPEAWEADAQELLSWLDLLDGRVRPHAEALLEVTSPPLARGLLFGMDARPGGLTRFKVYFRFNSGMGKAKRRLLAALAGNGLADGNGVEARRLFIIGFDVGPRGVSAIKFYFLHDRMESGPFVARFPQSSFYPTVNHRKKIAEWREVIFIARQAFDRRDRPPELVDANVHCLRNDITLEGVHEAFADLEDSPDLAPVISLFARHPVILSSITFPIRGGAKANIYYRLVG